MATHFPKVVIVIPASRAPPAAPVPPIAAVHPAGPCDYSVTVQLDDPNFNLELGFDDLSHKYWGQMYARAFRIVDGFDCGKTFQIIGFFDRCVKEDFGNRIYIPL